MRIAKVVKSNSHVDYIARVIEELEAPDHAMAGAYGFAQFVRLPASDRDEVIGIIYDSQLVNPEYVSYGSLLSTRKEPRPTSPDDNSERGVLVGIILLGSMKKSAGTSDGEAHSEQEVPRRVIPVGQEVYRMESEEVRRFHFSPEGTIQLRYYSQVIAHAGAFAVPLLEAIIEQLEPYCPRPERQRLGVLKKTLNWQRTLGGVRL